MSHHASKTQSDCCRGSHYLWGVILVLRCYSLYTQPIHGVVHFRSSFAKCFGEAFWTLVAIRGSTCCSSNHICLAGGSLKLRNYPLLVSFAFCTLFRYVPCPSADKSTVYGGLYEYIDPGFSRVGFRYPSRPWHCSSGSGCTFLFSHKARCRVSYCRCIYPTL